MLRMSKLTDYGLVLLTLMAQEEQASVRTAQELAQRAAGQEDADGFIVPQAARAQPEQPQGHAGQQDRQERQAPPP